MLTNKQKQLSSRTMNNIDIPVHAPCILHLDISLQE